MILELVIFVLVIGALVVCVMTAEGARRYLATRPIPLVASAPISILKPLSGLDDGLEENLRSFFTQQYRNFEIVFAVRTASDVAIPIVEKLQREYPAVPARLIVTGEPPYPNAKVFSLDRMMRIAKHDLLVMSDSDVRVTPNMLATIAAEFQDPTVGIATCPYRAIAGSSPWSSLESIGMNTDFMGGILVARMLEGMKFAVGPTIVARRWAIDKIGGFGRLKDYLAEDFVLGKFAAEEGIGAILSSYVIEHRIGSQDFRKNAEHRLRWNRSTRRSRPMGYIGQLFTMPVPLALLLTAVSLTWVPLLAFTIAMRAVVAYIVAGKVLGARIVWWMLPLEDLLVFAFWVGGFFGNRITWRGRKYNLLPDGRFELIA